MKDNIEALLDEHASLIQTNEQLPHDYASLREHLLQVELTQEISLLRNMLTNMSTFNEAFRQRCRVRETDREHTVPLSELPESPANCLYWAIAEAVFNPVSMKEMLAILAPGIKTHLQITFPETLPTEMSPLARRKHLMEPIVNRLQSLAHCSHPPKIDNIKHLILCDEMILDAQELSNFNLSLHSRLQIILKEHYPAMAEKLYTHNAALGMLSADCYLANSQGMTPYCAIDELIKGLVLGGSRMTGSEFASKSTELVIARFSDYLHSVPETLRNTIRELKTDNTTLGKIIDKDLAVGHCVETAAAQLSRILQEHQGNSIMHTPPGMSEAALRALQNKYKAGNKAFKGHLDTEKDYLRVRFMPDQLTRDVLQRMEPQKPEELIVLLLNFPPVFYDTLFAKMTISGSQNNFAGLSEAIRNGFFNKEQREALFKALLNHYHRFNLSDSFLFFTIQTNDSSWVEQAIHILPVEKRLNRVQEIFRDRYQIFKALSNSSAVKALLNFFSIDEQLTLIQQKVDNEVIVLHYSVYYFETFTLLLNLYPKDQLLGALKQVSDNGNTVLHEAASNNAFNNNDSLKLILSLYPAEQQLDAIKQTNNDGETVLYCSKNNHKAFKILFNLYPKEQRLDALKQLCDTLAKMSTYVVKPIQFLIIAMKALPEEQRLDAIKIFCRGKTNLSLLQNLAHHFSDFKKLLRLLPEEQILGVVKQISYNRDSVLSYAVSNSEDLNFVLALYPKDQQLDAVKQVSNFGKTVLHNAMGNPNSLKIILALYPEEQRLDAIKHVIDNDERGKVCSNEANTSVPNSNNGKTALHFAASNLESLKITLELYPKSQWQEALTLPCNHGDTPLHYATNNPDTLKFILDLYPKEQWFDLLQHPGCQGQTALHYAAIKNTDLRTILPLYPENKLLDVIKHVSNTGRTALHYSGSNSDNLKTLLEHYPEDQRIAAITQECNNGLSALDYAYIYSFGNDNMSLDTLLSVYPEEQRAAVTEAIYNKHQKLRQNNQAQELNGTVASTNTIEASNSAENEAISQNEADITISREILKSVLDSYQSTSFFGFLSTLWIFSCFISPQRSQAMIELNLLLEHSHITQEQITTALAKDSDGARRISFFRQKPDVVSNGTGTDRVIEQLGEAFRSNSVSI